MKKHIRRVILLYAKGSRSCENQEGINWIMKKFRRVSLIAVALIACVAIALTALGEGALSTLFTSATDLAFKTKNVTLNANAKFTYDGAWFKTLDGTYVQDGGRSLMRVMLDTPKEDGSVYTGGYTVVGEGTRAYSVETYNKGYYTEASTLYSETLMTSNAMTNALVDFGALFLDMAEGSLSDKITVSDGENGKQYAIKLQSGDMPKALDSALSLLAQVVAQKRYGITPAAERAAETYCLVEFEDWNALFMGLYQTITGEPMPDDFFDKLWGEDEAASKKLFEVYSNICEVIDGITNEQYNTYHSGVSYIRADATVQRFDTQEEYIVAAGQQYAFYDDMDATFRAYYQETTGQELTEDMQTAIRFSGNDDLWNAYYDMTTAMDEKYVAFAKADGKAVSVRVHADGTHTLIYEAEREDYSGATVKYQILYAMNALSLDSADCVFTLDQQGRLASGKGSVTFNVIDANGKAHPLAIEFDVQADGYGTSEVKAFDPADYNVTDFETFWAQKQANEAAQNENNAEGEPEGDLETSGELDNLPASILFNGVEYDTMLTGSATNG